MRPARLSMPPTIAASSRRSRRSRTSSARRARLWGRRPTASAQHDRDAAEPLWDADDGQSRPRPRADRSEEHTSELQSLMRNSYAVFCLKKKKKKNNQIKIKKQHQTTK